MRNQLVRRISRMFANQFEDRTLPSGTNFLVGPPVPATYSDAAGGSIRALSDESWRTQSMSSDGRFVVFASEVGNLVSNSVDVNGSSDIFLLDRNTKTTTLVSHSLASALQSGNRPSYHPSISADGRYVVFESPATDLIANMISTGEEHTNIFLFDRLGGTTQLISHRYDKSLIVGNCPSYSPMISDNGETIVFYSRAVDLVPDFPAQVWHPLIADEPNAYAFNRVTGNVTLLNHEAGTPSSPIPGGCFNGMDLSVDGRYIAFQVGRDIYRHDLQSGSNLRITQPLSGSDLYGFSMYPSLSADGQVVAFSSTATNLVSGVTTAGYQVYVYDGTAGNINLSSHQPNSPFQGANGDCEVPEISGDGRFVTFATPATDLVSNFVDGNGPNAGDIFLHDRLTQSTILVSRQTGTVSTSGNKDSSFGALMSDDGRFLFYGSQATDLILNFVDGNGDDYIHDPGDQRGNDLYRFDRLTETTTLISNKSGSAAHGGNRASSNFDTTPNGNVISWDSYGSDFVAGLLDTNKQVDVYVRDMTTNAVSLVSQQNDGPSLTANGSTESYDQSADGRFIVFTSTANNLIPGQIDDFESLDVFLFDRITSSTSLISHAFDSSVTAGNSIAGLFGSKGPVISADGRYVAYTSYSTNLVAGFVDANGGTAAPGYDDSATDIYLFDRVTDTTQLVSRKAGTTTVGGNYISSEYQGNISLSISDDGRFVAFSSQATDLIEGMIDNNGAYPNGPTTGSDIYVFDRVTGLNSLISHMPGIPFASGTNFSYGPRISGDGSYVTFWGRSNDIAGGSGNAFSIFVHDRLTDSTALVSHAAGSAVQTSNGINRYPDISRNGKHIVYPSTSNNLIAGQIDPSNSTDVVVYEVATGLNTLVSHTHSSLLTAGDLPSDVASNAMYNISDDGRFIAFASGASNLIAGFVDNNGQQTFSNSSVMGDFYLYDRLTGQNTLVSHTYDSATKGGNSYIHSTAVSGEGRFIAFSSLSSDLVANLVGIGINTYQFDRLTGATKLVSHGYASLELSGNASSDSAQVSHDGSVVVYRSTASNLVPGDFNVFPDIFAYVTPPPRVTSVQINDGSAQRSTIRSMTITVDDYVFVDSSPLSVVSGQGQTVGSVQWAAKYENNTTILTLTFGGAGTEFGSLADGKYELTLNASKLSGVGQLDGNGDGVGGDNFTFQFQRLFGDSDGDGTVSALDFNAFRLAYLGTGMAFDFNNDGQVTAADFNEFRLRYGSML